MARASGSLLRMIDANLNRAGEGLRVAEDVLRFVCDSRVLSAESRAIRHAVGRAVAGLASRAALLRERDSVADVGAGRWQAGRPRSGWRDLLAANLRRAQESVRVLEEAARVLGTRAEPRQLQALRYRLYELDRRTAACRASR